MTSSELVTKPDLPFLAFDHGLHGDSWLRLVETLTAHVGPLDNDDLATLRRGWEAGNREQEQQERQMVADWPAPVAEEQTW